MFEHYLFKKARRGFPMPTVSSLTATQEIGVDRSEQTGLTSML